MPNVKPINPLINPPDEVLRAGIELEGLQAFKNVVAWLKSCLNVEEYIFPGMKEETESRWNQGRAQALKHIIKPLVEGREMLQARETRAKEAAFSRNV